ncbi:hypothetical protein AAH979_43190, partial [Plantactinospora sp. ZYX-F-223]|uniref:hypothetical protein n=1 Tax=Plantactinospora sp. ZYX-F-223 TaxID=3144103 RepID=UPI0031FD5F16
MDIPERAVLGVDRLGIGGTRYPEVDALLAAVGAGIRPPAVLLLAPDLSDHRSALTDVLTTVQQFTSATELGATRLVVLLTGASVAAGAVLGLLRVVQSEHPGRVVVAEVPETGTGVEIERVLGAGEDHVRVHEDGSL